MTPADLETAVARTGHERYRWLTSDDNPDVEAREGYRRSVRELAAGPWPPESQPESRPASEPAPPADFAALRNAARLGSKNCWFSERDAGCGCAGLQCHLLGRRINIYDCVKCLDRW